MLKNRVCACLLVALLLAAMLPVSVAAAGALPSGDPAYKENTFVGVSPLGTTINLFDYWLTGQTDPDNEDRTPGFENQGINKGHALLFGKGMDHKQYGHGLWNTWTGSEDPSPRTGIVANELGDDGYPVLNQGVPGRDYMQDREGGESLAYLFDPDRLHNGKAVYKDVQGLLSINEDDYYAYDSTKNYAVYYQTSSHGDSNNFRLYDRPGVLAGGSSPDGQFFPFNAVQTESRDEEYYNSNLYSNDAHINHYFGLHMSTRFVQQYGGYTTKEREKEVTYTFSGDDDVWVFIDGTLVADLGGIHDMASLSINFATGEIKINGESQKQTLGDLLNPGFNTLPDDTYHTLDFFYLERGNVDSNMSLKYNLVYVPESSIYKIDQDGNPLRDRDFELYKAELQEDGSYDAGDLLAKGTTDTEGRIILLDENNDLLTIQELFDELNPEGLTNETTALILRETDSPDDGYRSSGDLELYFYQSQTDSPPFLLSRNHWQTGAHAVARLAATTNASIVHTQGTANFEPDKNLMFAVVFKKVGNDEWRPISGSPATGWTIAADDSWESIQKANLYRFMLSSSGSYTAMIDELPGDIKKYVDAAGAEGRYRIGYYFSDQNDLEAIDESNTFEITSPMNRMAAVNLYVPNIRNDLTVQKLDQNGNLITDGAATFELRPAPSDGTYNPSATAAQTRTETTSGGEATFTAIPNGVYYLEETAAPKGYTKNATPVKVIVNDTGVYANAGTEEDGISVERGVGRLVNSMAQFASENTVDTTLNQIVAKFYTTETEIHEGFQWRKIIEGSTVDDAAFSPVEGVDYHPAYSVTGTSQDAQWYLYGTGPDGAAPVGMHLAHLADHSGGRCNGLYQTTVKLAASGGPGITAQETDTGWSALLVEQCMRHTRDSGTPHTDLTGANLTDLTALFTGDVTVKVKNDPIVGNLAVQKTVAGNAGDTDREWNFTIELKNADGTALSGNFRYKGESIVTGVTPPQDRPLTFDSAGKATIRLRHGQKITIEGIPANVTYTVTETEAGEDGYVTTPGNGTASGKIEVDNTATAAFTNTRDVFQSLTVKKTVGGADGDKEKLWRFTIELKKAGAPLNGTFHCKGGSFDGVSPPEDGTLVFVDGKADIYLKHGQTIAIENLPVNVDYIVTEDEAGKNGYETEPQSGIITGSVQADAGSTAAFLNARTIPRGGLTVTKTVEGDAGDTGREWHFTVTLEDAGIHGTYGGMRFTNGVAKFALKHDQAVTDTGLPAGTPYTVIETEAGQEGYITKAVGDRGRIPDAGTAMATFTNMKNVPRGNLTVSKTVSGSGLVPKTAFGFTVTLNDRTVNGRYGGMTFHSGMAEFTLRHGETVTASGLPAGVGYLVEEDADEAYTTSSQGAEGTVPQDDTALARFVNSRIVLPPKTGDDSPTELWFMLMAFSLCCAAFLIGHQKRGGRTGR